MAKKKKKAKPFTKKEMSLIKDTPAKNIKDLAFALGKNYESVRRAKWRMENIAKDRKIKLDYQKKLRETAQLTAINKCTRWTKQEEEYLLSSDDTDTEIAKALGRTLSSVQIKRARLEKEIKEKQTLERKKERNANKKKQ